MKRKLLTILLSIACIFSLAFGLTACIRQKQKYTIHYSLNNDGASYSVNRVVAYQGYSLVDAKVAATYRGLPVTSIRRSAVHSEIIKSITLPDSITSIDEQAFTYYPALKSIKVASGNNFFHSTGNCLIETASRTMIVGCYSSVIPSDGSVTSIGNSAFSGCTSLKSISIPDSVTSIGESAFYSCYDLASVTFGNNLESIGEWAFARCKSLKSISIPDSVTSIGGGAFSGCTSLKSLSIPDSVTSIGYDAFSGCSDLASVTFGNNVTSIGNYAFSGCTTLKSISIPASVTSIGSSLFADCSGLESITVSKDNTAYQGIANCLIDMKSGTLISGCKNSIIPAVITTIGEWAFSGCTGLVSIDIPDGVTDIMDYAFSGCTGLENVVLPAGLLKIHDRAFYNCESLKSVTIPASAKYIGYYVFDKCKSLESAIFKNCEGWVFMNSNPFVDILSSELADPATAANYLKENRAMLRPEYDY